MTKINLDDSGTFTFVFGASECERSEAQQPFLHFSSSCSSYIPLWRQAARAHGAQPQLGFQSWMEKRCVWCWGEDGDGALTGPTVLLWQEVVGQRGGVGETLDRGVEEARVPEVMEAGSHPVHALPFQGEFVPWKQHLLGGRDAITLTPDHIFWDLKTETELMRHSLGNGKRWKAFCFSSSLTEHQPCLFIWAGSAGLWQVAPSFLGLRITYLFFRLSSW